MAIIKSFGSASSAASTAASSDSGALAPSARISARVASLLGSLDYVTRQLIVHTSPEPGQPAKAVVLIEDNGPFHTSKLSLAALAARAHWLTVEWLPKFAPELNDVEVVWHDLKAHHLAHQTFADPDALNQAIHHAVEALNTERMALPLARPQISA